MKLIDTDQQTMHLFRLGRDIPGHATLFAAVLNRIARMSARFGGYPHALVNRVWLLYAANSNELGIWALHDQREGLVGHGLGFIEMWGGDLVAWIFQVETDVPATRQIKDAFLRSVEEWVKHFNMTRPAQMPAVSELYMQSHRMHDAWARHAGFDQHRVIYRRNLSKGE